MGPGVLGGGLNAPYAGTCEVQKISVPGVWGRFPRGAGKCHEVTKGDGPREGTPPKTVKL